MQAIGLITIPYHSTSLPISLLHKFEVDNDVQILFINCLLEQFEVFQHYFKGVELSKEYVESAFIRFSTCTKMHKLSSYHPVFDISIKCLIFCISMSSILKPFRLKACFINCYESHTKKH